MTSRRLPGARTVDESGGGYQYEVPSSDQSPVDPNPVTITPYPDGPYLVRGDFVIQDQDGKELGTERRTVALCRCGKSRIRPLCDGTHKLIGFKAPSSREPWPAG